MRLSRGLAYIALLLLAMASAGARVADAQIQVKPPGVRYASTKDDAEFMQGMIGHHAQALVMAKQAETQGASASVKTLAARIIVGQRSEITLMQDWLRLRGYAVPDSTGKMPEDPAHAGPVMPGADTAHKLHPGMLTPEQMGLLSEARGATWDRLFLTFMIQHHQGAITMVQKLFASPAGGQDDDIFKFASGVEADQSTEIERMKEMLEIIRRGGSPSPR
jgi:uncharacterized protein (DUF305 family)